MMCKLTYLFLRGIYVHLRAVSIFGWTTEATSATWASPAMSAMPPMSPLWLPALYSPQVFLNMFESYSDIFSHWVSFAILLLISDFNTTRKTCDICKKSGCKCVRAWPQVVESVEHVNDGFVVGATKRSAIGYRDLHIVDGTCQCEAFSRRAVSES